MMAFKDKLKEKAYYSKWRAEHREDILKKQKVYMKNYAIQNKERIAAKNKRWYNTESGIASRRSSYLKNLYGITLHDYNDRYSAQNGKCLICLRHQSTIKRIFVVDHDHKTGKIRGLLCNECNAGLGYFQESPSILAQAIFYLKENTNVSVT